MGSGAFGVGSVSAFSVTARIGGGTGTLSRAGPQGRQGGRHALVVVHPNQPIQVENVVFTVLIVLVWIYSLKILTIIEDSG